ncbi:MAG: hypothetical protein VX081_02770, partial [Pseudomonadota bacterium]|nr:hypothetical protein [Pseudomonadota bacterium]
MPDPHKTAKGTRSKRRAAVLGAAVSLLAACAGDSMPETGTRTPIPVSGAAETDVTTGAVISTPSSHQTSSTAGHYLKARQALYFNDVIQSADFFLETLETDADSVPILRQAFLTQYYYGDIERAAALGRQLESLDVIMPLGGEPGTALAIRNG